MSYINSALRKLQKEEKTRYVSYEHIVTAPGKKSESSHKLLTIIGILIVFLFAAGTVVFFHGLDNKKVPVPHETRLPVVATPVEPEPDTKVDFKPHKTPAKVRTAREIDESEALFAQALLQQREGKLEESKKLYRKAIKIDKDNVQAFNNLGVIYMGEKNYKRAIISFNDALNIKHDYTDAHYNLACLYAKINDVPQSLFYLKNAIEFNPDVKKWAKNDDDLKSLANTPEFKKMMEKQ